MFQSIDDIQRIFDIRRVVTGACNIDTELVPSNLQCLLETSRLVPRMFSPSCDVLRLLSVPVNFFAIHVCLLRVNEAFLLKQKDECLDVGKSLISHIWHSRALVVFDLMFEGSHLSSTVFACHAEVCIWLTSRTIADEAVVVRQLLSALSPRLAIIVYAIIDQDLLACGDGSKCVHCEIFRFPVPCEVRIWYARMVQPGSGAENPLLFLISFSAHCETICREDSIRCRWVGRAAECFEMIIFCLSAIDRLIFGSREELGF